MKYFIIIFCTNSTYLTCLQHSNMSGSIAAHRGDSLTMHSSTSLAAHRGDSFDDFDGFWLTEINIDFNKNASLNFALKSVEEKVTEAIEIGLAKVKNHAKDTKYLEMYVLPLYIGRIEDTPAPSPKEKFRYIFDVPYDTTEVVIKKKKAFWKCFEPCVKF
jgi:hypothetical protein